MASGTLYTYPENIRAYKALIAAKYSGTDLKVSPNFIFGKTNKCESFLKKFPSGKVPAFEGLDGRCLSDSNAIAYYVSNQQLRGNNEFERAQILQWLGFADSDILPASCALVFPVIGILKPNQQNMSNAREEITAALHAINAHLATRTFLVSERVSLADIVVACSLIHLYQYVMDPVFRKPFPNLHRWYVTIIEQPNFKSVAGQVKICSTSAVQVERKPAHQHQAKPKKDDKKEKKEKAPPAKKEPEEEPEPDIMDDVLAAEPQSKDPFDLLPKGTFNFDDFKRVYSNEDETKSVPYFWEKFDPENYSIWLGEYKYNNELTKVFMSCNLITGMFQRLDKMRKATFASVCLFGDDDNSTISGIWIWRGPGLAFELTPDWQVDYETYQWTKLDPSTDSTKELVQQYLSWTGTDKDGRKFNQGKIFK